MKKELFLMVAGAAVLAGCSSNKVMNDRYYVPAAASDPAPMEAVEPAAPAQQTAAPAAPVKAAPQVSYAPMTDVQSSGGVSSAPKAAAPAAAAKGGTYVVQSGDTLGKIAARHNVRLRDLLAANNMTEADAKRLAVGRKLVIPGARTAGKAAAPAKKAAPAAAKAAPQLTDGYYIVKSGDSLALIARRLNVKVSDLQKANNLSDAATRRLQIGQKLVVPGKTSVTAAAVTATAEKPAVEVSEDSIRDAAPAAAASAPQGAVPATSSPALDGGTGAAAAPAAAPVVEPTEDTEMVIISEDSITVEAFSAKHGITVEEFRRHNKEYENTLKKDDIVFVLKK